MDGKRIYPGFGLLCIEMVTAKGTNMPDSLLQIAEVELVYKNQPNISNRPQINKSSDGYDVLIAAWDENKIGFVEQVNLLLLNRANRVLGVCTISTGGVSGTIIDPKLVFIAALKANASSIIIAHNHPSENTAPSQADRVATKKLTEAGLLLDITLLDHLIVTPHRFYSFSDNAVYDRTYPSPT